MGEQLYQELYQSILEEHKKVFEKQDLEELKKFINIIKLSHRIFVLGVGREGIAGRAFSMRLMHLGKEVHWVWDDTTPGMEKGDLCILITGSGKIGHLDYIADQAKKANATLAVVTGTPEEKTPKKADYVLFIPAAVFNGTDSRVIETIQPMGNLFEQHAFILFYIIVMLLEKDMKISYECMERRHRNIE